MQNGVSLENKIFTILGRLFLFCLSVVAFSFIIFYGLRFYREIFKVNIALGKTNNIEATESVVVNFSVPVWKTIYADEVRIVPEEKIQLKFNEEKRKLIITPEKNWQPGKKYNIHLPTGKSAMFTEIAENELDFTVAAVPQAESVVPENGAKDVVIGVEDPIIVNFNKSTKGYFIKFVLNPESEIIYQNNPEKTQFKLLPKNRIQDGTKYDLKIYAKLFDADDADYQDIYEGSFETKPMTPIIWEKDFQLRLSQAKQHTRAKIIDGKYIDINLSTQIMTTFENGNLLNVNLISSGQRGMDTPIGEHKIYNKSPRAYSKTYGLYMPYWMAITADGKFGIHELPEWPGGYKEGANHLGIPVSHGCVRLGVGAAKTVFDWAEVGTPVIVY